MEKNNTTLAAAMIGILVMSSLSPIFQMDAGGQNIGSQSSPAILVSNGRFIDQNGNPVYLHGINVMSNVISRWNSGVINDQDIATLKAMKINAVRLPVFWDQFESSFGSGYDPVDVKMLDDVVKILTDAKIAVIINVHAAAGDVGLPSYVSPMYSLMFDNWNSGIGQQGLLNFIDFMDERYKNNSYVIGFDILNEPSFGATTFSGDFGTFVLNEYNVWRVAKGLSSASSLNIGEPAFLEFQNEIYAKLIKKAADLVLPRFAMYDQWYGNQQWGAIDFVRIVGPETKNIVVSYHNYYGSLGEALPGPGDFYYLDNNQQPIFSVADASVFAHLFAAQGFPVVIGEFGSKDSWDGLKWSDTSFWHMMLLLSTIGVIDGTFMWTYTNPDAGSINPKTGDYYSGAYSPANNYVLNAKGILYRDLQPAAQNAYMAGRNPEVLVIYPAKVAQWVEFTYLSHIDEALRRAGVDYDIAWDFHITPEKIAKYKAIIIQLADRGLASTIAKLGPMIGPSQKVLVLLGGGNEDSGAALPVASPDFKTNAALQWLSTSTDFDETIVIKQSFFDLKEGQTYVARLGRNFFDMNMGAFQSGAVNLADRNATYTGTGTTGKVALVQKDNWLVYYQISKVSHGTSNTIIFSSTDIFWDLNSSFLKWAGIAVKQPPADLGQVVREVGGHTLTSNIYTQSYSIIAPPSANGSPVVNAGPDQTIYLSSPSSANLSGTVTDDGLPNGTLTTTWKTVSGPSTVTFGNINAVDTTAVFTTEGTYVLRLTVSDGELSSSDDIVITVNASLQSTASLSAKQFARPINTTSTIGDVAPIGALTLHEATDESIRNNDTDYARVIGPNSMMEIALSSLADPGISSSHVMRVTAKAPWGGGVPETFYLELRQGGTLIASTIIDPPQTNEPYKTFEYALTSSQADSITDYSTLRLRVTNAPFLGNEENRITQLEFEVPADITPPPAASLISPANNIAIKNVLPTFDWTDVTDTSGVTYGIEVSAKSDFSNHSIDQNTLTSSTFTTTTNLLDNMYYWRVHAKDGAGNIGEYSSVFSLMIDTVAPVGNATITSDPASTSGTVNLKCSDVNGSGCIEMRVATDGLLDTEIFELLSSSKSIDLLSVNTVTGVAVEFKDKAGNVSKPIFVTVDSEKSTTTDTNTSTTVSDSPYVRRIYVVPSGNGVLSNLGLTNLPVYGKGFSIADAEGLRVGRSTNTGSMVAGWNQGQTLFYQDFQRSYNFDVTFKFKIEQTENRRVWIGFVGNDLMGSDYPTTRHVALRVSSSANNTNFVISHSDGTTRGEVDTGVVADTNIHSIRFVADDIANKFQWSLDGRPLQDITSAIPTSTSPLGLQFQIMSLDTGVKGIEIWYVVGSADK